MRLMNCQHALRRGGVPRSDPIFYQLEPEAYGLVIPARGQGNDPCLPAQLLTEGSDEPHLVSLGHPGLRPFIRMIMSFAV